jgi:4-hydroxy-3-methylbut-2-enyl diphosphate reductase
MTTDEAEPKIDKRVERRRIMQSTNFYRMGFKDEQVSLSKNVDMRLNHCLQQDVKELMAQEFTSPLVDDLRSAQYTLTRGDITIKLAKQFGFCWGVERAVAMAYEAARHFPNTV